MSESDWLPPVGARLREVAQLAWPDDPKPAPTIATVLAHVDTHDDGVRVVIRHWSKERAAWRYEVLGRQAFLVGIWTLEAGKR